MLNKERLQMKAIYKSENFPQKLYHLVSSEDPSIISWVPNGDAFQITNAEYLVNFILPNYFNRKFHMYIYIFILHFILHYIIIMNIHLRTYLYRCKFLKFPATT